MPAASQSHAYGVSKIQLMKSLLQSIANGEPLAMGILESLRAYNSAEVDDTFYGYRQISAFFAGFGYGLAFKIARLGVSIYRQMSLLVRFAQQLDQWTVLTNGGATEPPLILRIQMSRTVKELQEAGLVPGGLITPAIREQINALAYMSLDSVSSASASGTPAEKKEQAQATVLSSESNESTDLPAEAGSVVESADHGSTPPSSSIADQAEGGGVRGVSEPTAAASIVNESSGSITRAEDSTASAETDSKNLTDKDLRFYAQAYEHIYKPMFSQQQDSKGLTELLTPLVVRFKKVTGSEEPSFTLARLDLLAKISSMLAMLYKRQSKVDASIASYEQAIEARKDSLCLVKDGAERAKIQEFIAKYERALAGMQPKSEVPAAPAVSVEGLSAQETSEMRATIAQLKAAGKLAEAQQMEHLLRNPGLLRAFDTPEIRAAMAAHYQASAGALEEAAQTGGLAGVAAAAQKAFANNPLLATLFHKQMRDHPDLVRQAAAMAAAAGAHP